jgi:hypothetical protein
MDEQHAVFLIGGADDEQAVFTLSEKGDLCRLKCEYRNKAVECSAPDFFQALCDVREHLASDGLIPFCYGASLNVYPSGMARSMGYALKAYRLAQGKQARTIDLVEIFAEGPDVIPASVGAQQQFFDEWLASLSA